MTDNEIIKAWKVVRERYRVPTKYLIDETIDLIDSQKAEIERLKAMNQSKLDMIHDLMEKCETAKTESIKEFAERLKEDISSHRLEMYMNGLKGTPRTQEITYESVEEYIDNLVKEMVGDNT